MIPRSTLEDLKGESVRVYLNGLPDPHCSQKGVIESFTEHILILRDEAHTDTFYIPIENIVFIKKV